MEDKKLHIDRLLNTLFILVLSGVLIAAYTYQFVTKHNPCPLCELQRLAMIFISFGLILNLRLGIHASHYALSLIGVLFGGSISLRQISLHICTGFPKNFTPVFGLQLFVWAFLVFACSLLAISLLLFMYKPPTLQEPPKLKLLEKGAIVLIFLITVVNVITAYLSCGFKVCPDT